MAFKFIKQKSIKFFETVLSWGNSNETESNASNKSENMEDIQLLRSVSRNYIGIPGKKPLLKAKTMSEPHRYGRQLSQLTVEPPAKMVISKSVPNVKNGNINDDDGLLPPKAFKLTKSLSFYGKLHASKYSHLNILPHDAMSVVFTFLDKKEIGIFIAVSTESKCIFNQYCLRYCHWMVKKRNDGGYFLKYIESLENMENINIETLTWCDKYRGNESWKMIYPIVNGKCDDTKCDDVKCGNNDGIKSDDVWYLLNEYWFGNKNFGWGTFDESTKKHKKNGEWRVLNNPDVNDESFYLDVKELNGILAMLRHPLLYKNFVKNMGTIDDAKIDSEHKNDTNIESGNENQNENECSNNCLDKPIQIIFDKRKDLYSKIGNDTQYFDEKNDVGVQTDLKEYTVTYWNGAALFKTTGIKISGRKIHKKNSKKNDVIWVDKEILYCNFLTNIYYGDDLTWEWFDNDTCEYVEYEMDNLYLISQLECNYQSNLKAVFAETDRKLIWLTSLNELKRCLKANIQDSNKQKQFEVNKYFKFRCFYSENGSDKLHLGQIALTRVNKRNFTEYDRIIRRRNKSDGSVNDEHNGSDNSDDIQCN